LLATAVCQLKVQCMARRSREQAPSHIEIGNTHKKTGVMPVFLFSAGGDQGTSLSSRALSRTAPLSALVASRA
jgi:hypothetical protein